MTMTIDDLVAKCEKLRGKSGAAESKFFEFLISADADHRALWQGAGFKSFRLFLEAHPTMCSKPESRRYGQYKLARAALGANRATTLGVEGAIAAHKASLPAKPRAPRRDVDALETENDELRIKLTASEAKVAELRAEVGKLQKRLVRYEGRKAEARAG